MFVRVQEVSCDTPGMMSKRILAKTMSTKWMTHAPGGNHVLASASRKSTISQVVVYSCGAPSSGIYRIPLALTQFAFKFGRAAWSLICSNDSGGSVYMRLLERLLRPFLLFKAMLRSADDALKWAGCGSPAKVR